MEEKTLILCDTDIIIEFLKGNHNLNNRFIEIGYENIYLSSITVMEMYTGAFNKKEIKKIMAAIGKLKLIHVNESISIHALELIEKYTKSHGLALPDAIIAATAIENKKSLFTLNLKDFRFITGLNLYK